MNEKEIKSKIEAAKKNSKLTDGQKEKIIKKLESMLPKEEPVFIEFLNKDKNFTKDKKHFKSYEAAETWARKNMENFNRDMIHYEKVEPEKKDEKPKPTRVKKSADDVKPNKVKPKYKKGEELHCISLKENVIVEGVVFDNETRTNLYTVTFQSAGHSVTESNILEKDLIRKKAKSKKAATKDYTVFEEEVTAALVELLEASRGDAQGVVEANAGFIKKEFKKGTDAVITAGYIVKKGEKKSNKRPKVAYQYKGRHIKELSEEDCEELRKDVEARRKSQAKSEKKSKSKPVIEKIAKNVAQATKQAIKNVSAADLKNNPKKELDRMAAVEKLAKKFLSDLRVILGEDYDKDSVEGEFKEVHGLIKDLKAKYGK